MMEKIEEEFPEIVTLKEIGTSYQGRPITMAVVEPQNKTLFSNDNRKSVLLTGAHHARELSSISMTLYYLLRTVYGYFSKDPEAWALLNSTTLLIIPVVNVDGFVYISSKFKKTGELSYIRKNRNDGKKQDYKPCSDDESLGVDLNRNYDLKFGANDIGSGFNPCAEDFRGPFAFSEPETVAMRDLITARKNEIVLAFNFHAYGNLLIYPFNYDNASNPELFTKFHDQALFYDEVAMECGLPEGNIRGNAM